MEKNKSLITKLPYIALIQLFEYLDQEDIFNLSYTCKTVFQLINSNSELSRVKNLQLLAYKDIDYDSLTCRLERLDLSGSEIDDAMLLKLSHKENLRLKAVDLGFCSDLSNKALHYFLTLQKELTYIGLAHCPLEKEDLQAIAHNCQELQVIDLHGVSISPYYIGETIIKLNKKIQHISLGSISGSMLDVLKYHLEMKDSLCDLRSITYGRNWSYDPEEVTIFFDIAKYIIKLEKIHLMNAYTTHTINKELRGILNLKHINLIHCSPVMVNSAKSLPDLLVTTDRSTIMPSIYNYTFQS